MNRFFAFVAIAACAATATASPITLNLSGRWETNLPNPNISVIAVFDSASPDQNSWDRIGAYELTSLKFNFTELGGITVPYELLADVTQSLLHLYPSTDGGPGEVRLFGWFNSSAVLPNGFHANQYDLRMHFTTLADDSLNSLGNLGAFTYSSLYLTDQIGARSSNLSQSDLQIEFTTVPEPATLALLGLGLTGLGFIRRRRSQPKVLVN